MIIEANQLPTEISREEIINRFCDMLQKNILEESKKGYHSTVFYVSTPIEVGEHVFRFSAFEDEIAEKFIAAGYVIKPTGYIGGVYQLTKDICW